MSTGPETVTQGSENQSQSTFVPNSAAMPMYGFAAGNQTGMMQQPVPYFPGYGYVGPSTPTQMGVDANMQAAQNMDPYLQAQQQNYNFLSTSADVANNPYVQAQMAANQQAVMSNLTDNALPAISRGAQGVNAMGGSRQGVAEGRAIGDASNALAQANAATMMGAYNSGLAAQQYALGQTGNMMGNMLAPGNVMQMQGQTIEGYQQQALNDAMNRFQYQYTEPYNRMGQTMNTANFLAPTGVQYTHGIGNQTAPNPNYQDPFSIALGLGGMALGF